MLSAEHNREPRMEAWCECGVIKAARERTVCGEIPIRATGWDVMERMAKGLA